MNIFILVNVLLVVICHYFNSSVVCIFFFDAVIAMKEKKKQTQTRTLFSAQSLLLQGYVVVPQGD